MKNFSFILILLLSFSAFGQNRAEGTSTVHAELVRPITITSNGDILNFGSIVQNSAGGSVRIANDGTRTFSNMDMQMPTSSSAPSAATFSVTGAKGFSYGISIPNIILTHQTQAIELPVDFTHNLPATGNVATGSPETLSVGGLLVVAGTEPAGHYKGTVTVTVAYE